MAKKKSKTTKKEESITYVKVDQPVHLRKRILETAVESAELLKKWEGYQKTKEEKAAVFKKLVTVMNKIEKETNALKKHLPKSEEIKFKDKASVKPKKTKSKAILEREKPSSDIDREISDIQAKIKGLKLS